jgi:tetratricopeptide (TPR) repeat protein
VRLSRERGFGWTSRRVGPRIGTVLILASVLSGCGGGSDGPGPDTTPPVITSGPTADARGDTVEIHWTTNETATSVVLYGLEPGYGLSDTSDALVVQHDVVLIGLVVETTYYYSVESMDAAGNGPVVSDQDTFITARTAGQLAREGWALFEAGDFAGARSAFALAQTRDPSNADAWLGGGWGSLRLGDRTLARSDFEEALSLDPYDLDAAAGLAAILATLGERQESGDWCEAVLDAQGDAYEFEHDPGVTSADLRVLLAENYMYLLELDLALEQVQILDPAVEIDPADPETWGEFATFDAALLAEIGRLAASFGT